MPSLEVSGSYVGVESFRQACNLQDASRDAVILEHLLAASRDVERLTFRRFFPVTATNYYRWPSLSVQNSWTVWLEDDVLSVTTLQAQASGNGATPTTITHYYLEPQQYGPPYSRIEVDLSYTDVFTSGPTPQRSISVLGSFGYCNTTRAAGTLAAAITSTTATSLVCSNGALIDQGDVLLIDSEAIYVDSPRPGTTTLNTLQRGVNGTTPTTHLINAPIVKYQAPASIRRLVRADAMGTFMADLSSWGRTIGAGEMSVEWQGKSIQTIKQQVINEFRRTRTAVI